MNFYPSSINPAQKVINLSQVQCQYLGPYPVKHSHFRTFLDNWTSDPDNLGGWKWFETQESWDICVSFFGFRAHQRSCGGVRSGKASGSGIAVTKLFTVTVLLGLHASVVWEMLMSSSWFLASLAVTAARQLEPDWTNFVAGWWLEHGFYFPIYWEYVDNIDYNHIYIYNYWLWLPTKQI